MKIEWKNIKKGFKGFETLAIDYVNEKYLNKANWKQTKDTRDGNKDGIAILVGYGSESGDIEWWMEAKYSSEKVKLTRYRIDSTVVSAILNNDIRRVVFVSNLIMNGKSMEETKVALLKSTTCEYVEFFLKPNLELWLLSDKKIYERYFPSITSIDFNSLEISDGFLNTVEFYSLTEFLSFSEPLKYLYLNETYKMSFTYLCNQKGKIKLQLKAKNITFLNDKKSKMLNLQSGINHIEELIRIRSAEFDKYQEILTMGNISMISSKVLKYIDNNKKILKVSSQQKVTKILEENLTNNHAFYYAVNGESGVGKSYLLNNVMQKITNEKHLLYFGRFTDNELHDAKIITHMILFILFPYLSSTMIDKSYLKDIKIELSESIFLLMDSLDSYDNLHEFLIHYHEREQIFNKNASINKRIIILEDIQKLSDDLKQFIKQLFMELYEQGYLVSIVISGQNIEKSETTLALLKQLQFEMLHVDITMDDILINYSQFREILYKDKISCFFSSIIELRYFIEFLESSNATVDESDFLLGYNAFMNSKILKQHVKAKFASVLKDPNLESLCNYIYYSYKPVPEEELLEYISLLDILLQESLIKYENDCLIPIHDIFKRIYQESYMPETITLPGLIHDKVDHMRNIFYSPYSKGLLMDVVKEIEIIYKQQRLYTVYYILNAVFTDYVKIRKLKKYLDDIVFYNLYLQYAMASANSSSTRSGFEIFHELYQETNGFICHDILIINCKALFEVINSEYENMKFKDAENHIIELFTKLDQVRYSDDIKKYRADFNFCFLSTHSIQTLIKSETSIIEDKDIEIYLNLIHNYDSDSKYLFTVIRLALNRLGQNQNHVRLLLQKVKDIKKKGIEKLPQKEILLIELYSYYIENFMNIDLAIFIKMNEKLKNDFFNDYRRHLFMISILYLIKDSDIDKKTGNDILIHCFTCERKLRSRQEAIYAFAKSIQEYRKGECRKAIESINKARAIFANLTSYTKIIDHNIEVMNTKKSADIHFEFYDNNKLDSNVFYIDPRYIY